MIEFNKKSLADFKRCVGRESIDSLKNYKYGIRHQAIESALLCGDIEQAQRRINEVFDSFDYESITEITKPQTLDLIKELGCLPDWNRLLSFNSLLLDDPRAGEIFNQWSPLLDQPSNYERHMRVKRLVKKFTEENVVDMDEIDGQYTYKTTSGTTVENLHRVSGAVRHCESIGKLPFDPNGKGGQQCIHDFGLEPVLDILVAGMGDAPPFILQSIYPSGPITTQSWMTEIELTNDEWVKSYKYTDKRLDDCSDLSARNSIKHFMALAELSDGDPQRIIDQESALRSIESKRDLHLVNGFPIIFRALQRQSLDEEEIRDWIKVTHKDWSKQEISFFDFAIKQVSTTDFVGLHESMLSIGDAILKNQTVDFDKCGSLEINAMSGAVRNKSLDVMLLLLKNGFDTELKFDVNHKNDIKRNLNLLGHLEAKEYCQFNGAFSKSAKAALQAYIAKSEAANAASDIRREFKIGC